MSISENLQNLRKKKNMSQEELAEKLNVSRQAVSKWESGNGYPETEKIIAICDIFECSMDEFVKGKISLDVKSEKNEYCDIMDKQAKGITFGIFSILLGVCALLTLIGLASNKQVEDQLAMVGVVCVLIGVLVAMPLFIVNGMRVDNFKKKNVKIANMFTEDEQDKSKVKYAKLTAAGICLVLLGVVVMLSLIGFNVFGEESNLPVAFLMYFVTGGVSLIVYADKKKEKYDIERYNKENSEEFKKENDKIGKVCAVIMIITTMIYLAWGFILSQWHINWCVFPIGGMLCGIVSIVLQKESKV